MKQKKFYIAPEMEIENVIVESALLAGSAIGNDNGASGVVPGGPADE